LDSNRFATPSKGQLASCAVDQVATYSGGGGHPNMAAAAMLSGMDSPTKTASLGAKARDLYHCAIAGANLGGGLRVVRKRGQ
jgi:nanoRNase/pAp phosphatase (c-di-AMP/oligoRNAs hydrolase)